MNAKDQFQYLQERRARVAEAMEGGAVLLLFAGPERIRNHDVAYPYRAKSHFQYLAGFEEPDAVLVLDLRGPQRWIAYVQERDEHMAVWLGERPGYKAMAKAHGLAEVFSLKDLDAHLPDLLAGADTIYHILGDDEADDRRLLGAWARVRSAGRRGKLPPFAMVDASEMLGGMRLFKDQLEVDNLMEAARITALGHAAAREAAVPGAYEYQVQAAMEAAFRHHGSSRMGYDPIVASGPNACVLHYVKNARRMKKGDLLLIDAGTEVNGYTADVTRTQPVGAAPNDAQKRILDLVLKAQHAALEKAMPGSSLQEVHEAAVKTLTAGLIKLGVLDGPAKTAVKEGRYAPFYPHGTSHWLGLDVHDTCPYRDREGEALELMPGMVFTIEPGLYFRGKAAKLAPAFADIGVRTEDNVLITEHGHDILTADVPK